MKKEKTATKIINWIKEYYENMVDSAKSENISSIYSGIIIAVFASVILNAISTSAFTLPAILSTVMLGVEALDVYANYKLENRSTFLYRACAYTFGTLVLPIVGLAKVFSETIGYKIEEALDNWTFKKHESKNDISLEKDFKQVRENDTQTIQNTNNKVTPISTENITESLSFRQIFNDSYNSNNIVQNDTLVEESLATDDDIM